ncbi:MAG: sigma 54-interacting transcriptional regulator [Sedimentibacter sp.]|uniref:sigma-54 interaction domain-containing protein n=1 Tax=Sedimentibacter sp. TaxID=1960295 RepID=UPI0031591FAF
MTNLESSIQISDLIDVLELPLHIINSDGLLVYVNKEWEKHMSINRENAIGKRINDVLQKSNAKFYFSIDFDKFDDNPESNVTHFKEALSSSVALKVVKTKTKISMFTYSVDNSKILVTSSPIIVDGQVKYVVTTLNDITESADKSEKLEKEIHKNIIISNELNYYRKQYLPTKIIGSSKEIINIMDYLNFVSKTNATVLITGESGVGKEVFANELYQNSLRNDKTFVKINCASIPENLIESELFGYEKGAFTGASKSKQGLFELADTGTILLDEIGEFPYNLQPKLLRVLQESEIMRVGGLKSIKIDVRVIAATNQDLLSMVNKGLFRGDLYYRLNVIPVHIPPLNERKSDIPLFVQYFLDTFNKKYGKNKRLSDKSMQLLINYSWPGNIRELENLLERLIIIGNEKEIREESISNIINPDNSFTSDMESVSLSEAVEHFERNLIQNALTKYGSTYKAAEALKSTQSTIVRKAHRYNLKW